MSILPTESQISHSKGIREGAMLGRSRAIEEAIEIIGKFFRGKSVSLAGIDKKQRKGIVSDLEKLLRGQ
jgi:hypothetical protein